MNCRNCNAKIDYLFLTNCSECGNEVEQETLPERADDPTDVLTRNSEQKAFTWKHRLANAVYVLVASLAGMISGAVVIYFGAAIIFLALLSGGSPGESCARGRAIGVLAILSGAYLGTVGGSVFAVMRPICKRGQ